jgi:hypothetical protein
MFNKLPNPATFLRILVTAPVTLFSAIWPWMGRLGSWFDKTDLEQKSGHVSGAHNPHKVVFAICAAQGVPSSGNARIHRWSREILSCTGPAAVPRKIQRRSNDVG